MIFQIHPAIRLFANLTTPQGLREFSSPTGIKPGPLAEREQSPKHWPAKEFPPFINLNHQNIISGLCLLSPIVLLFLKKPNNKRFLS